MTGPQRQDVYTIRPSEDVFEALGKLPETLQEKVTSFWRDHLQYNPHRPPIGGVHRLQGEWSEFYSYDVDHNRRMLYRVDDHEKVVTIEYLGNHPQWHQRRRWR